MSSVVGPFHSVGLHMGKLSFDRVWIKAVFMKKGRGCRPKSMGGMLVFVAELPENVIEGVLGKIGAASAVAGQDQVAR